MCFEIKFLYVSGGGSQGCNTLYQLTKRGVKAVLLERAKLMSGTTWHTAGCVWRLRPNDIDTVLLNDTRDVLMQLEAETGLDPGWIMNGGIFIAYNEVIKDRRENLVIVGNNVYSVHPERTKHRPTT